MSKLELHGNQLSGSIPAELGNLSDLEWLDLNSNQLSGSIPAELGNLNAWFLFLSNNRLSGGIPAELGNLGSNLLALVLSSNQLSGEIPFEITYLTFLSTIDISYNALWTDEPVLQAFLYSKDPDWDLTQTTAPADVVAGSETASSFVVSWTPILYTGDDGWYQITAPNEVFSDDFETGDTTMWGAGGSPSPPNVFMTVDKTENSILVDGLQPNTEYQFVARTVTEPHLYNQNQVVSEESAVVLVTTTP